jgi:hypothetical protein
MTLCTLDDVQKTTFFGALAAASAILSASSDFPRWAVVVAHAVEAGCLALLGYYASDRPTAQGPVRPIALVGAVLGLAFASSGCRVGGFSLALKSPAFGSLESSIGAGAVGNAAVGSAAPGCLCALPLALPASNAVPAPGLGVPGEVKLK